MDFTNLYKEKLTDPRTIAEEIQDNWVCGMDIAAGIPTSLANVIVEVSKEDKFKNVSMHSYLILPR